MASINQAGGISALKKVDRTKVRDRSAAMIPGGDTGPAGSGLPPAGASSGGGGSLADALDKALKARNKKVANSGMDLQLEPSRVVALTHESDDEADDDEWD